jgi:hypothetical protein
VLSVVSFLASFIDAFRWLYLPLGLVALLAVGIHAGADGMDDRLRLIIERVDALLDNLWGRFELTTPWVDVVGAVERTHLARGVALVWEVAVDFVVAWPVMRHCDERFFEGFATPFTQLRTQLSSLNRSSAVRIVRPIIALVFAGAGSYAIAGLVESALFKTLQSVPLFERWSAMSARFFGLVTMVWLWVVFGVAAVLVAFAQTSKLSGRTRRAKNGFSGAAVWPLAIAIPLAVDALLGTPVVSFFR